MISSIYKKVFSLAIRNTFYKNQICPKYITTPVPDFEFIPSEESQKILNRRKMIFKKIPSINGFAVLMEVSGKNSDGKDLPARGIKTGDKLTLFMNLKNPDFFNFSDVPVFSTENTIFYFNNKVINKEATKENVPLAAGISGASENDIKLKHSSSKYYFNYSGPETPVVTYMDAAIKIMPLSAFDSVNTKQFCFDLQGKPKGRYSVLIKDVIKNEFYYTGETFKGIFGAIEFFFDDKVADAYKIENPDGSLPYSSPGYNIVFNSRKTFWRYIIKSPEIVNKPAILFNKENIQFLETPRSIPNRLEFVSTAMIDLKEEVRKGILLKKEYTPSDPFSGNELKANLPNPGFSSIQAEGNDPIRMYSNIIVTL